MSDAGDRRKKRRDDFLSWLAKNQPQKRQACIRYLRIWTGMRLETLKAYLSEWHQIGLIKTTSYGNIRVTETAIQYLKRQGQAL